MRASVCLVFSAFLLVSTRPVAAEPAPAAAQSQAAVAVAATQLARAASDEAHRLREAGSASKSLASDRKPADDPALKSDRSRRFRAKLLEAERLRIRDEYREQQKHRIAASQPADRDPSIDPAAQSTAVSDAD